jgi:glycosyltransferase involved in cell wall biosynthesis
MKITVGIPVIRTTFLLQTLKSVVAQTYRPAQVVVIDNGAEGDVAAIVVQVDPSIQVIRRPRRLPPVENWNLLLQEVAGDWFILLSDDDFLEPSHLEQVLALHARHREARLLHTRVRIVDESGQVRALTPLAPSWESAWDFLWHRAMGYRTQFLSDFVWHSESLRRIGGFPSLPCAWGTDDLAAFRMSLQGGVAFGSAPTFNYRMHSQSISGSRAAAGKLEANHELVRAYLEHLAQAEGAWLEGDELERLQYQRIRELMPRLEKRLHLGVLRRLSLSDRLRVGISLGSPVGCGPLRLRTWLRSLVMSRQLYSAD